MNLKKITVYILLSLFSGVLIGQTQIKSFTEEPVKFMDELKDFFQQNSSDKGAADDFADDFEKFWKLNKLNPDQTKAVYTTCNLMLKKRLRAMVEFKSYLTCIMNFANTNQSLGNFKTWSFCVEKILNGKAIKNFTDYLTMSESLFYSNSFYKSPTYEWASNNSNYVFEYDSVPKVVFPSLNLSCYNSKSDSTVIQSTQGVYFPFSQKFIGKGGRFDWTRVGSDPNVVYAEIKKYEIICKAGGFTIDSVTFYHKQYFTKPLKGVITEKMISEDKSIASYPRFESYDKRLQIPNVALNVDYDGGFAMRGSKFMGAGSNAEDAYLKFKRNDKYFIVAGSKQFAITKEKLYSDNSNVLIFLENDTISHPGLSLTYLIPKNQLSLIRVEDGLGKTPFFNTFHAVDMYFEELSWKTDEPTINLKSLTGSSTIEADFESNNYYKQNRYDRLMGMDGSHPLPRIRDYIVKANGGNREVNVIELAKYMKITADNLRPMLVTFASKGFLTYFTAEDRIIVKQRLFNYISNRAGKTDYDVISFHSEIKGVPNASINLLNYDITLRGISSILLSDSQQVFIYPKDKQIILKKNRDFLFAGIINAGKFEFWGKEFSFEYDKFKINLTQVDSLRIKVESFEPNERGEYPLVRVKSIVENITGDLLIDHPKNKSGIKEFVQYPIFNSFKESYVFYDKKSKPGKLYNRSNFYFKLEPFTIDSLDNFSNKALSFKGTFASAGIFPSFEEKLSLQSDYSLGFVRNTPPDGFALYEGKGKFMNKINLSNNGLKGDGDIKYVTSTTKSNDIIFFPDSMNAHGQNFNVEEQKGGKVEFPQVKGENVYVHWMPKKDYMHISNKEKPFTTYNGQADFYGRYTLTPDLLSGNGKSTFSGAELESNNIAFKNMTFDADTSDFRLKATQQTTDNALAFSTKNVNAHIDFTTRSGEFKSNGKGSVVNFPQNQYMCFMDQFKWFMDKSDIELGSSKKVDDRTDVELTGSEFISTHPKQDSLKFVAPYAKYDTKNYIITAKEVKHINVADARVFPDSGVVVIEKNAVMKTLKNARIMANTVTKHHNLYDCTVNIYAKKSYSGSGYYDYVDELKKKQSIYFSNISVDTTYQTFASTEIGEDKGFTLSPHFDYKGKASLYASKPALLFAGAARIHQPCESVKSSWLKFSDEINPNQIYIPVSATPEDYEGNSIHSSLMLANDSAHVYSAFLSKARTKSDPEVFPSEGFLTFDKTTQEYRISNKEKLTEINMPGNYLSINTKSCIVKAEGKLNWGTDYGQIKVNTVGVAKQYLIPDSVVFEVMMGLNFFFDDNALGKMADEIGIYFTNLPLTDFSRPLYEKGLRELVGKAEADKLISQVNLYGSFKKFPDELKYSILFNDLKFKWNPTTKSYLSVGKIGVGSILKTQVNKYVDGFIEIERKKSGDNLNIYLELDGTNWYYFNYSRGLMQAISSNESFNNIIKELKSDKRQMKTEKGQAAYQFNLSNLNKKTQFIKRVNQVNAEEEEYKEPK
ncbi:MAG: hypothetical protein J0M08_07930 [Bacteroidetes bacterium]|nr:hypothetical protein [Bacteroidota bacterium]